MIVRNSTIIKVNTNWKNDVHPFITIMTPVYNRRSTIQRTIDSVKKQKFKNIEYIIIDDGSTESIDDIVQEFMDSTKLPVMFIKKTNGGVHTARNLGYRYGRGELVVCIDSDDELMPEACEVFYKTWQSIPKDKRNEYWQMKARLVDGNNREVSALFPDNINDLSKEQARKYFSLAKGDQIGCRVLSIMKKNLFPEPDGVTFVTENVRWLPLENKFRSWGIDKAVSIVHRESDDGLNHLSYKTKKKTKQDLRNSFWNLMYQLNDADIFDLKFFRRIKFICKYCVIKRLLIKLNDKKFVQKFNLKGVFNHFWEVLFWFPSFAIAVIWRLRNGHNKQ